MASNEAMHVVRIYQCCKHLHVHVRTPLNILSQFRISSWYYNVQLYAIDNLIFWWHKSLNMQASVHVHVILLHHFVCSGILLHVHVYQAIAVVKHTARLCMQHQDSLSVIMVALIHTQVPCLIGTNPCFLKTPCKVKNCPQPSQTL